MLNFLLLILALYAIITLLMYQFQHKFIFFPMPLPMDYPFSQFRDFEEVFLDVNSKIKLHALHFKVNEPKGTLLYFHGNTRSLNDWGYAAQDLTALGYDVLMPDYRTYGKSSGPLTEQGLYEDALRWYDHLKKEYSEKDLLLYGRSLGTGIASYVAFKNEPRQLILETPYTSMVDMAKLQVGFLPINLLSRFRFETKKIIQQINCPIDLIHGTADELIPYQQALDLSQGKAQLHTIENGGHNNLAQFPEFHQILKTLLP